MMKLIVDSIYIADANRRVVLPEIDRLYVRAANIAFQQRD